MRRFCCGDIHGAYLALKQVLKISKFNDKEDLLICLGDVADGWSQVPECFERLLKIKNLIYILGNHDQWLLNYFNTGATPSIWISQGGEATIDAYNRMDYMDNIKDILRSHKNLLERAYSYYVTYDNKLFVHGGFNWHQDIKDQPLHDLIWDRHLFSVAKMWEEYNQRGVPGKELRIVKNYDEVFIGHTTTSRTDPKLKPVHVSNVWNLDQGAGWEGKLTLMDIDTKRFFQSDIVKDLYPNEKGR